MKLSDMIGSIVFAIILIIIGLVICSKLKDSKVESSSPVGDIEIDSIKHKNDTLVIEVEHLDSIKDVKIIEVKTLDNDSTLKLFYELIRK